MPEGADKGSFVPVYHTQACKAQIGVDSASRVIVATEVTQETADSGELLTMLAQIAANLERKPKKASADAAVESIDSHIATDHG